MTQLQQNKTNTNKQQAGQVNPFARALAEMEKSGEQSPINSSNVSNLDAFRNALKNRPSDSVGQPGLGDFGSAEFHKRQQEALKQQQQKEALRKKLHDQVNPVEAQALFDAREKQVKEQIDQLRYELRMLVQEVKELDKEAELTLMTNVAEPGQTGSYFLSFFQKLRSWIQLLRQTVRSAHTWLKAGQGKRNKQMKMKGQGHQTTSSVQNMMHHERSTAYAGA